MSDEVFYCDEMYMDDLLYNTCCMRLDRELKSTYQLCDYEFDHECPFGGPFDEEGSVIRL